MKKLIALFAFSSLIGCTSSVKEDNPPTENFDWLLGSWIRTNEQEGRKTYENWEKLNDSTYLSHGYTLQAQDTVWQENIHLLTVNGNWSLQVKMPNDSSSTDFKVTTFDAVSFSCENPANEFPKVIKYRKGEGKLFAEISNSDMKIEYVFEPR